MDDYKPIGQILESHEADQWMDSQPPCAKSEMDSLMAVPLDRMTPLQCARLKQLATNHIERVTPATAEQLSRHLEFIAATLPSRNVDIESGQRRFAVYYRLLGGYSNEALAYMTERACRELEWFPTPSHCLAILADYRPPSSVADVALTRCHNFAEMQFREFVNRLQSGEVPQAEIDDKPDQWKRILLERGILRHELREGQPTYFQRVLQSA